MLYGGRSGSNIAVRDCLRLTALLVPHHKVTRSPEGKCRKTSALCPTCLEVAVEADTILTVLVFVQQYCDEIGAKHLIYARGYCLALVAHHRVGRRAAADLVVVVNALVELERRLTILLKCLFCLWYST